MNPEYVFFSGKGGVGKTSMACTAAVYHADNGKKTLIVTTDPASNLADVFEQPIGHHVTPITGVPNLWAMEIDPDEATREYKERSLAPMRGLFDDEMLKVVEEQLSGPCTEEMASFDKFTDFMEDDNWDVIIFDTAPTGHTLRLLELPVEWSKHIKDSAEGSGQTCMGPVALIQDSKKKYDDAVARLRDTSRTQFIFVMQAEQTSLEETSRSVTELAAIGVTTSRIIVNGLVPEAETVNPFFRKRRDMQLTYLERAKQSYAGIPVQTMELLDSEIKGVEMFRKVAPMLFQRGASNG
ncbi:arsenic-transporting ATPase [Candidatus Cryosericum hinesii]|jgi:arsenite-transporting ATPase|uniref:arsenite-transporting ATPase n=1 Tax=Candidatus Cryosericum hinesii TaxID=2290915 RepID=A0A398DLS3_9BACT|nr:ArsA family ATPase [Candidatus Cryosericum hinesii]RIE12154.1 arsenic-transporting ATPase [Candidatus Cryosericum hinesii]RIE14073.1 arsenic-transporting ATPase [Candidatus Cryosericum hinesii]